MGRFETLQSLLNEGKFFKLVCGAGNEDAEEVKRLSTIYTLAGAKGLDVSANINVVKSCIEGIELAFTLAKEINIKLVTRPYITVSVGMKGDHHVRKAKINLANCSKCKLCISSCPTSAISDGLIVNEKKCIGCGNCGAICPKDDVITFKHNRKKLYEILPKCKEMGVEHFELHAAIANDEFIMEEWEVVNNVNKYNYNSMCLDRLHLSDFALEERIRKAKEISGDKLIIQADGYPMSGGKDNFNTTLQAVAIADVINKRFNKNRKKNLLKGNNRINVLLSGGTNSLTADLARQCEVSFQGVSVGTFARKIVNDITKSDKFYDNIEIIKKGYLIAKKLIEANVGELNE